MAAAHAAREARREEIASGVLPPPAPFLSGEEFDKAVVEKITEELPSKRVSKPQTKFTIPVQPIRTRKEARRLRKEAEQLERARVRAEKAGQAAVLQQRLLLGEQAILADKKKLLAGLLAEKRLRKAEKQKAAFVKAAKAMAGMAPEKEKKPVEGENVGEKVGEKEAVEGLLGLLGTW